MFEAARHARNRLLTGKPHDPLSRYVACRTIARAVWNQDMALARRIVLSHPFGRKFISLDVQQQSVGITDPIRFHAEANEANSA
eukprot:9343898-Pyramimonas_sp.AAC.1